MSQLNIDQIEKLIKQYYESASELLKYTDKHWDAMYSDIQGYSDDLEYNYTSDNFNSQALLEQVNAVKMLLEAHKSLNYIYG
jgi:hypothetical protein